MELNHLAEEFDQCIKCGLCLATCPVCKELLLEKYTPRGKIQLARFYDQGILPLSDHYRDIFGKCLLCGACSVTCPSGVDLNKVFLTLREAIATHKGPHPMMEKVVQSLDENQGIKPCTYCGILRRKALNVAARRWNADKLVTAHTLDDEIQSFILNILHGDTAKIGLMIPVLKSREMKFVPKIKPYSEILESESSLYAYLNEIVFQTTPCPYRESSMRSEVRRFLNMLEVNHPGMKFAIKKSLKRISTTMVIPIGKEHKYCEICGEPSSSSVCKACKIINALN